MITEKFFLKDIPNSLLEELESAGFVTGSKG